MMPYKGWWFGRRILTILQQYTMKRRKNSPVAKLLLQ